MACASGGSAAAGRLSPRCASASTRLRRTAGRTVFTARPSMSATWPGYCAESVSADSIAARSTSGLAILERLVGEIEPVAVQVAERARRLDTRLRRRVVEHRLERLLGLVGPGGGHRAPHRRARRPRGRRPFHLRARQLLGLGHGDEPRVERQRRRPQPRRRLGTDRLLQHRLERGRGCAGTPQDRERRDAHVVRHLLAGHHARQRRRALASAPWRRSTRTAPAPRGAPPRPGSAARRRARRPRSPGARSASAAVSASARRRRVGSESRNARVRIPAASTAGSVGASCRTAARTSAERSASAARKMAACAPFATVFLARLAAVILLARLATVYGRRHLDAAAPDLRRVVGERVGEDLVFASAAAPDHRQRRENLAARRGIGERLLERRHAVGIAEQRLGDPARHRAQAVQHLAQPTRDVRAAARSRRRRVERAGGAAGGDPGDRVAREPGRRVAGVGEDRRRAADDWG